MKDTALSKEIWVYLATSGEWTSTEDIFTEFFSRGYTMHDIHNRLWIMVNRHGMAETRGADRTREYRVTPDCQTPKGLRLADYIALVRARSSSRTC